MATTRMRMTMRVIWKEVMMMAMKGQGCVAVVLVEAAAAAANHHPFKTHLKRSSSSHSDHFSLWDHISQSTHSPPHPMATRPPRHATST